MPRTKLTQAAIKRAVYEGDGKSRYVLWDAAMPGFGLRVYPTGRRAFVLSYRNQEGRKRMMTIGDYGPLTLDQARTRARKHLVAVEDGHDPLEDKRKVAKGATFSDLADDYLRLHARPRKRSWREDERRLRMHIPSSWRNRRVGTITRSDIAALHAAIGATRPYESNRLRALLHTMFRLARRWGYLDAAAPNPAADIEKFRERQRKRWLRHDELPALARAIDAEPSVYVRGALWALLLTGLRKRELLTARRSDVDWERCTLRLPKTKAGEEQVIALSAPALGILQSLPVEPGNPHLFPGARKGKHLVNIDQNWRRVRKSAGLDDLTIHDLRRTTGSWMSQSGVELNTIKHALRHMDLSTTLVYARLGEDAARAALEAHGQQVMKVAGKRLAVAKAGPGG